MSSLEAEVPVVMTRRVNLEMKAQQVVQTKLEPQLILGIEKEWRQKEVRMKQAVMLEVRSAR